MPVQVRKPEKGTRPKVFYIEGDAAALVPVGGAARRPTTCGRRRPQAAALLGDAAPRASAGAPRRTYGVQGAAPQLLGLEGVGLPVDEVAGRRARSWCPRSCAAPGPGGEPRAAGALLVAAAGPGGHGRAAGLATCASPTRFLWTLTRPQWRSWLTRGVLHHRRLRRAARAPPAWRAGAGCPFACRVARRRSPRCWPPAPPSTPRSCSARPRAATSGSRALLGPHLIVQALTAGAALFAPSWLLVPAARERPAGGGRGLGPPRHRGRAPRGAPHPGRPRGSPPACSAVGPPAAAGAPLGARRACGAGSRARSPSSACSSGSTSTCRRPSRSRSHDAMTIERLPPGSGAPGLPARRAAGTTGASTTPQAWPRRVERRYMLVPTICFNCEAACGLLAYVDKDTMRVRKFEGNPLHPASRGRNCAKGPATINQIHDPERILYPLKRAGARGAGQVGARDLGRGARRDRRAASARRFLEGRRNEVMYHVGRPGHERHMDRVLKAWGIDGHNSHTNVCSSSARLGYALWRGYDRPSPDHANARFILLLSSHLETGPLLQPPRPADHRRQAGGREAGGDGPAPVQHRVAWPTTGCPPTRAARRRCCWPWRSVILDEGLADLEYVERWTNWREYMADRQPERGADLRRASWPRCKDALRGVHARVRGGGERRAARRRSSRSRA